MSVQLTGSPRPNAKAILALVPVLLLALVTGMLMGAPSGDVALVYAALCQCNAPPLSSHGVVLLTVACGPVDLWTARCARLPTGSTGDDDDGRFMRPSALAASDIRAG